MNIAVYCSSRSNLDRCFIDAAAALGEWIGKNGNNLVYGGSNAGTMHTLAQAAHDAGAHITGVVPQCFAHRADPLVDTLIPAKDLAERKDIMIGLADEEGEDKEKGKKAILSLLSERYGIEEDAEAFLRFLANGFGEVKYTLLNKPLIDENTGEEISFLPGLFHFSD